MKSLLLSIKKKSYSAYTPPLERVSFILNAFIVPKKIKEKPVILQARGVTLSSHTQVVIISSFLVMTTSRSMVLSECSLGSVAGREQVAQATYILRHRGQTWPYYPPWENCHVSEIPEHQSPSPTRGGEGVEFIFMLVHVY